MQVKNSIQRINTFKAHKISTAKVNLLNKTISYDIYNVSHKDQAFFESVKSKINLRDLFRGLRHLDYELWFFIINKAMKFENSSKNFGYLLASEDKICGIMNCSSTKNGYYVDYVATWPLKNDQKAPFAGKVLFMQLFSELINSKKDFIRINAIKESPFDVCSKYRSLNFTSLGGDADCEMMRIFNNEASKTYNSFRNTIELSSVLDKEVDLNTIKLFV